MEIDVWLTPFSASTVAVMVWMTPAMALGITDHVWSVGELIEAALKAVPSVPTPTPTPAQRRKSFRVIQGDLFD